MGVWLRNRWWWIVVILALSLVGWEEERCQTQAYQCRAEYAPQLASVPADQKAAEQEAIAAACEPNGYFCRLFGATNLPTVLLVIVGVMGILEAVKTLNVVERQTKASEDAADAAKRNIDIIVGKERARIQFEPTFLEISHPLDPIATTGVTCRVRCYGTTIATIVESKVCAQITDSRNPPAVFEIGHQQLFIPSVLVPDPNGIGTNISLFIPDGYFSQGGDVREEVRVGRLFVHFYGFIRYTDLFGGKWKYQFRYLWSDGLYGGRWYRIGEPTENEEVEDNAKT